MLFPPDWTVSGQRRRVISGPGLGVLEDPVVSVGSLLRIKDEIRYALHDGSFLDEYVRDRPQGRRGKQKTHLSLARTLVPLASAQLDCTSILKYVDGFSRLFVSFYRNRCVPWE